jgi:hypothetical protein
MPKREATRQEANKDLGGTLPLFLGKERIFRWTYGKTLDSVKITKAKCRILLRVV